MSVTIRTVDHGMVALLDRMAKATREVELTVGIHDDAGAASHGRLSVIQIASVNEFGLGVPERSFIRAWADTTEEKHRGDLRKLGNALKRGSVPSAKVGMAQLGQAYVGEVQARIAGGIAPPNAPATIARKKSSTPLIDKGIVRSSVAAKVDGEGAGAIAASAGAGGRKAGRKAKRLRLLARKLRAASRRLRKAARRSARRLGRATRRLAARAQRSTVRRLTRAVRQARRSGKRAFRSGRRGVRSLLRSGKRAQRAFTRSVKRTVRGARRAVKSTARRVRASARRVVRSFGGRQRR